MNFEADAISVQNDRVLPKLPFSAVCLICVCLQKSDDAVHGQPDTTLRLGSGRLGRASDLSQILVLEGNSSVTAQRYRDSRALWIDSIAGQTNPPTHTRSHGDRTDRV